MSTDIYDGLYNYEKELRNDRVGFVPLGSKNPKAVKSEQSKNIGKPPLPVQSRRANASPSTMTAMYGIRGTSPIITYDRDLGRPFSPIEVNTKSDLRNNYSMGFKPISQQPAPMESSITTNRGSPLTYMEYERSLASNVKKGDDWDFYDTEFNGGKKRTRNARKSRKARSMRRKRTKKSYSRRYRSRKTH